MRLGDFLLRFSALVNGYDRVRQASLRGPPLDRMTREWEILLPMSRSPFQLTFGKRRVCPPAKDTKHPSEMFRGPTDPLF